MNKKDKEIIIEEFIERIKKNPEKFPFSAKKWEITIKETSKYVEFSSSSILSSMTRSFYKPFSKIIDIFKIND